MQKKNDRQKIHTVLKHQNRVPRSFEFFKRLLLNPESGMKEFLPLYEFVLFYNTCFTYNSTQRLKTFLTKNELDSTSFSEFEQVFQTRRILHPLPKNCGEKPDLTVLSKQESILLFSFISDIFLFLNSSPVGAFSQKSLRDKAPILEQVDTSFFEALSCKNSALFKQKVDCFDSNYNCCLKETLKIWYLRQKILEAFFTLKLLPASRFYSLVSLLYLDQKLESFLSLLASINHLSNEIRERAVNLRVREEIEAKSLIPDLAFQKFLELLQINDDE